MKKNLISCSTIYTIGERVEQTNTKDYVVQKLCEKIFKKQGSENQKDAMRDDLTYQGNNHQEAIEHVQNKQYLT